MHDDMSKSIGKHSLQWGYLFSNTHYDGFGVQNISGTTGFSFRNTSRPAPPTRQPAAATGLPPSCWDK